ncbi:MAG: hypothetical protein ACK5JT_16030, partial [Hyphomicrobiaceae bacterium]
IQRELIRVGCYSGQVDGKWGPASRLAMQTFVDKLQARLPVTEPDYILLTLLQGHTSRACGPSCPGGQAPEASGMCVPASVIAAARKATPVPAMTASTAVTTGSVPSKAQAPAPQVPGSSWADALTKVIGAGTVDTPPQRSSKTARIAQAPDAGASVDAANRSRHTDMMKAARKAITEQQAAEAAEAARVRAIELERQRIEDAERRRRNVMQAADAKQPNADTRETPNHSSPDSELPTPRRPSPAAMADLGDPMPPLPTRPRFRPLQMVAMATVPPLPSRAHLEAGGTQDTHAVRPDTSAADDGAVNAGRARPTVVVEHEPATRRHATTTHRRTATHRSRRRHHVRHSGRPRFVRRFVPLPTYRVGRLSPSRYQRARYAPRRYSSSSKSARWQRTQGQFLKLLRQAP